MHGSVVYHNGGMSEPSEATASEPGSDASDGSPDDALDGTVSPDEASAAESPRGPTRIGYQPGLDGLRALSVLAVLAFHFQPGHGFLPGGFLGVEVFFVISGYLITSLLFAEHRRNRRVSMRDFWARRARRLLPALYTMLLVVALVVAVFFHDELGALRMPLLAGATYWSNIQQILSHAVYGQEGVRVPLQHLWSLAVEEQFYLVWPLVFVGGVFLVGRRRFRWIVGALALLSSSWMTYLSLVHPHPGTNAYALHLNRIYLGTDTRIAGILWGAFLACFWSPRRLAGDAAPSAGRLLERVGLGAGAVIVALMFVAHYDSSQWLYTFGFQLVDLCTVLLIACTVHPLSRLGRWFGTPALRAVGVRSYGIYVWGIVVFEFTRPGFDLTWPSVFVLVLRLVLVGVIVETSYRLLEVPVRNGALERAWREMRAAVGERRVRLVRRWQVVTTVLCVIVLLLAVAAAAAPAPHTNEITDGKTSVGDGDAVLNGGTVATFTTTTIAGGPTTTLAPGTPTSRPPIRPQVPAGETGGYAVTAVGDSVLLGASGTLARTPQGWPGRQPASRK